MHCNLEFGFSWLVGRCDLCDCHEVIILPRKRDHCRLMLSIVIVMDCGIGPYADRKETEK
jgi:hypothetical protein